MLSFAIAWIFFFIMRVGFELSRVDFLQPTLPYITAASIICLVGFAVMAIYNIVVSIRNTNAKNVKQVKKK